MGAGTSPAADSPDISPPGDAREVMIDAALDLFTRQGYDATTAEQIAAAAGVSHAGFTSYFATPESVLVSLVDDMSHATAAALKGIPRSDDPERALLNAGSAMLTGIVDGQGPVSVERLLAMARVVSSTRNLHRKVSAARRRVIARPLADWMGVAPGDRRLQRALTMWSAVTASAYVAAANISDQYDPQHDDQLQQRMINNIAQSYGEVMGDDPS